MKGLYKEFIKEPDLIYYIRTEDLGRSLDHGLTSDCKGITAASETGLTVHG